MRREDITYQDKLNELMLDVAHPNSQGINFIFVEGKSDIKLFRKLFDTNKCKVENIPGGKDSLERGVSKILSVCSLVLGVRDADFINLNNQEYLISNILLTDYHDIETTILSNEVVLNALLFEYTNLPATDHLSCINEIMKTIELVSYLKWLNENQNLQLTFTVGFQDLISFDDNEIDFERFFQRVISKSPNAVITDEANILNEISTLRDENPEYLQLTNGHDLLRTLTTYFKEKFNVNGLKDESLAGALRMTFNHDSFAETSLYRNLKNWEQENNTEIFT